MSARDECAARVKRLLNGPFQVEDLNRIFAFLRQEPYGAWAVRDIADMLAHKDERSQGLSVDTISDVYRVAKFKLANMGIPIDLDSAPPDLIEVMRSSLTLLKDDTIKRHLGYRRAHAETLFKRLQPKFKLIDGRLRWSQFSIYEKDLALIRCLTGHLSTKSAYSSIQLFSETKDLLLRHKLITQHDIVALKNVYAHITLFAMAAMHGVKFILPDGEFAHASAGWDMGENYVAILNVTAQFPVVAHVNGEYLDRRISFPLFTTDLKADDWSLPQQRLSGERWNVPLEVTTEPRIQPIG